MRMPAKCDRRRGCKSSAVEAVKSAPVGGGFVCHPIARALWTLPIPDEAGKELLIGGLDHVPSEVYVGEHGPLKLQAGDAIRLCSIAVNGDFDWQIAEWITDARYERVG